MSSIHGIDHPNSGMRKRSVIAATLVAVSGIGALGASGGHGCSRRGFKSGWRVWYVAH